MTRRLISEALVSRPDVLILDEPTSHLDTAHQAWLIKSLRHFKGLVILVSHNRAFLREVAMTVWSFENGKVTAFNGNYEGYLAEVAAKRDAQMQAYKAYVSEKSRLSQRAREAGERSARAKKINPHKHSRAEVESIKNNSNGIEKGFAQQRKTFNSRQTG